MPKTEPDYLDTAAVARVLLVERETVRRYIFTGKLVPDNHFGRTPVFRPATIRAYIDALPAAAASRYRRRVEEESAQ